jgi:hypothetical protein
MGTVPSAAPWLRFRAARVSKRLQHQEASDLTGATWTIPDLLTAPKCRGTRARQADFLCDSSPENGSAKT